jgi:hypothetical protein
MTDQHPITPPPELVYQWIENAIGPDYEQVIATQAARWGADQELEACCKLLELSDSNAREFLTAARRPKPPSLKEQALVVLDDCANCLDGAHENTIRRALEALDD